MSKDRKPTQNIGISVGENCSRFRITGNKVNTGDKSPPHKGGGLLEWLSGLWSIVKGWFGAA